MQSPARPEIPPAERDDEQARTDDVVQVQRQFEQAPERSGEHHDHPEDHEPLVDRRTSPHREAGTEEQRVGEEVPGAHGEKREVVVSRAVAHHGMDGDEGSDPDQRHVERDAKSPEAPMQGESARTDQPRLHEEEDAPRERDRPVYM
ncbi:MAG: hypothetical protein EXS13_14870 [Planctomycetes bacterium]|nr:hypothetical protein [Planctomycetota bacterium]